MLDLHTHILPGIDDGSRSLADAVAMARAALADGVTTLAATPHVRDDWPTRAAAMEEALAAVRAALAAEGVPLHLLPGGEVALEQLAQLEDDELRRFGLGGNPGYLLLEMPYAGWPLGLAAAVASLLQRGVVPVIAHPERNPDVQRRPELLRPIVLRGALCQVTAASLDGRLGRGARATALVLVDAGLAHMVASDAHAPEIRAVGMRAAAHAVGDELLAHWLTVEVPQAIVDDLPVPARPETVRPRGLRRLLGR